MTKRVDHRPIVMASAHYWLLRDINIRVETSVTQLTHQVLSRLLLRNIV